MALSPSDQTRIVNAALAELGSNDTVVSIDDHRARRAKALWDDIVRDLLVAHPWNFAVRRRSLNVAGAADPAGWTNRFQLPEDCLRWLPARRGDVDYHEAELEGRFILSNAAAGFPCRYIAAIDDVSAWPPAFVRAVVLALAAAMAEGVTQSQGDKDRLLKRSENALSAAKRADGLETGPTPRANMFDRSAYLRGRMLPYGGLGRRY